MLRLSPEQEAFQARMRSLTARGVAPLAEAIEATSAFPQAAYDLFAAEKLFAVALPKSHGGQEADALSLALMVEAIASVSPSSSLLVFPTNAVLRTIALTGSAEQKDRLFAELGAGVHPMGFCLTEPDHGSDAANIQAKAERRGEDYIVSGTKSYVTLGPHARYYLTFVRTGPGPRAEGLSALLIPRDAPGVSFGPPEKKLGLHGSVTCQMFLDQARVPVGNRLLAEGEGWRVLREVANPMRAWGAAALALGAAQGLFNLALAHARATGCGRQQAIGFALAEMKMQIEACRSLVYRVCGLVDDFTAHPDPAAFLELESMVSLSKCFAADTGVRVANLASQVLGRAMVAAGCLAASLFCVTKGVQVFDGSNQVQRLVVARNLMEG